MTDEFFEAFIGFYINTIGVVDGSRCICGLQTCPDNNGNTCIPGTNDLLTCCGAGGRSLFYLYGDAVEITDPDNCYTSAPNRNYIGRVALVTGVISESLYPIFEDILIKPLMQQGINDVFNPYLDDQNFVGYRDGIDTTLDKYFGVGNEDILDELKRIKCKYDPNDVFNHELSIPVADDCDDKDGKNGKKDKKDKKKKKGNVLPFGFDDIENDALHKDFNLYSYLYGVVSCLLFVGTLWFVIKCRKTQIKKNKEYNKVVEEDESDVDLQQ